jgi:succinyl-CoA synthetase beta subunit
LKLSRSQAQAILNRHHLEVKVASSLPTMVLQVEMGIHRQHQRPYLQVSVESEGDNIVSQELIDPLLGLHSYQLNNIAGDLGLPLEQWRAFGRFGHRLYRCFCAVDAENLRLHDVFFEDYSYIAQSVSLSVDENAQYRQANLVEDADYEVYPTLQYIELNGQVGCLANGAGLCMTLMDTIYQQGEALGITPACFVKIEDHRLLEALESAVALVSVQARTRVMVIYLISMWYPIENIAEHLKASLEKVAVPVIVVLEGEKLDEAKQVFHDARLDHVFVVHTLMDAAKMAVEKATS